jgi:membrane protein
VAYDVSPYSPEERAKRPPGARPPFDRLPKVPAKFLIVGRRVLVGVINNGFMYAGNLAYLALLAIFPFFIVAAAIAAIFGQSRDTALAVSAFLHTVPHEVSDLLRKPIADVLAARTGSLLWLGAIVGLWTVGSFVETIRDIFRRAYGVRYTKPFWQYRLSSMLVIVASVVLALLSFLVQGILTAIEQFIYRLLPWAADAAGWVGLSRAIPGLLLFGALYALFYSITPSKYRYSKSPKWPGALLTSAWWVGATALLPVFVAKLGHYDLTYGSLAGVILALFFFYIVGLGISIGAELNAALAETPRASVEDMPTDQKEAKAA